MHAADATRLVDCQSVFKKLPTAVNDLCARLDLENLFGTRQSMALEFHILGRNPLKLASYFDTLLLVNNSVVKHARHMSAITLRRISVQYHTAVLQPLFRKGLPFDFPNCTGTRCSKLG